MLNLQTDAFECVFDKYNTLLANIRDLISENFLNTYKINMILLPKMHMHTLSDIYSTSSLLQIINLSS